MFRLGVIPSRWFNERNRSRWMIMFKAINSFIVRRLESIVVEEVRSRGRPKNTLVHAIKSDFIVLNIANDIVLHRTQWNGRIRFM